MCAAHKCMIMRCQVGSGRNKEKRNNVFLVGKNKSLLRNKESMMMMIVAGCACASALGKADRGKECRRMDGSKWFTFFYWKSLRAVSHLSASIIIVKSTHFLSSPISRSHSMYVFMCRHKQLTIQFRSFYFMWPMSLRNRIKSICVCINTRIFTRT